VPAAGWAASAGWSDPGDVMISPALAAQWPNGVWSCPPPHESECSFPAEIILRLRLIRQSRRWRAGAVVRPAGAGWPLTVELMHTGLVDADVVVIGAGALGLSTALHCALSGRSVVVWNGLRRARRRRAGQRGCSSPSRPTSCGPGSRSAAWRRRSASPIGRVCRWKWPARELPGRADHPAQGVLAPGDGPVGGPPMCARRVRGSWPVGSVTTGQVVGNSPCSVPKTCISKSR
jgi:hypothetical protein